MSRYRMEDGTIIDTEKASKEWMEATFWDGRNQVSRATGDQFYHQKLYRSRKGRYYVECWSDWQGSRAHAEMVSPEEAARWLLANECDLPEDLAKFEDEIIE